MSIPLLAGISAKKEAHKPVSIFCLILGFETYVLIMNNSLGSFLAVSIAMLANCTIYIG